MLLDVTRMVDAVLAAIDKPILALARRIAALEKRQPERGEKGEPGDPGPPGPAGDAGGAGVGIQEIDEQIRIALKDYDATLVARHKDIESIVLAAMARHLAANPPVAGERGADGAPGRDGSDGVDGRDGVDGAPVTLEQTIEMIDAALVRHLAAHPPAPGRDGKDGADGAPGERGEPGPAGRGMDGAAGRDGIDGKDGEAGPIGEKGADGPIGRDGVGVAGAVIDREGVLILTMADGRTVPVGAVIGRDGAPGPIGPVGDPGAIGPPGHTGAQGERGIDGLGFDDLSVVYDGARTFTLRFARAEAVKEFAFDVPVVIDRGVYKTGGEYAAGDGCTWGGSFWIAQAKTGDKPGEGSDAWRLAVKRGRDGKDGTPGAAGDRGPQGNPGRDGRQL